VRLAQLLKTDRAERRHAEHCAVFRSRSRDGAFALIVEETLQGGRRAVNGQRELLAHDGDREINVLDAAQDVRHEIAALEGLRVTPKSRLVVCAAVDLIENRSGQLLFGQTSEIMEVVTITQTHAGLALQSTQRGACRETSQPTN
jgi:hypothetical protein